MTASDVRECTKCLATKAMSEFRAIAKATGWTRRCMACLNAASRDWQSRNSERAARNLEEWRKNNPSKVSEQNQRRVARYSADPEKGRPASKNFRERFPDKVIQSRAKWYAENREASISSTRAWRAANPDRVVRTRCEWRLANLEHTKDMIKKWRLENPTGGRRHAAARRARVAKVGGKLSTGLAAKLLKLQRGRCACGCGKMLGRDYHLDHRIPLARGGPNTDNNMQLLRKLCNLRKSSKDPIAFMREKGFLI